MSPERQKYLSMFCTSGSGSCLKAGGFWIWMPQDKNTSSLQHFIASCNPAHFTFNTNGHIHYRCYKDFSDISLYVLEGLSVIMLFEIVTEELSDLLSMTLVRAGREEQLVAGLRALRLGHLHLPLRLEVVPVGLAHVVQDAAS